MKKMNFKAMMIAMSAVAMLVSCESNDDDNDTVIVPDTESSELANGSTLSGTMTKDVVLGAGNSYTLTAGYIVPTGLTLTIEEGVTITAADNGEVCYILVEQGATINAEGTASAPIVMTAEVKESGAWGGLHICGYASTNKGTNTSEIGDATYGGFDDSDSSGILKYIRLEYGGYAFSADKEGNGFTFYGVGSGTTVEYLQAYKGNDDGFEWFGGTVNAKYLIATDNGDDSFDWTEGWRGNAQFLVAYQISNCDQTIEADNSKSNYSLDPISNPTLANMTLVGKDSDAGDTSGILLRNGTYASLYNVIATGKTTDLVIDGTDSGDENGSLNPTDASLTAGTSILEYVVVAGKFSNKAGDAATYTEADFLASEGNAVGYDLSSVLSNVYYGTIAGGKDMSTVDSFFSAAGYIGALDASNDWTAGWSIQE